MNVMTIDGTQIDPLVPASAADCKSPGADAGTAARILIVDDDREMVIPLPACCKSRDITYCSLVMEPKRVL